MSEFRISDMSTADWALERIEEAQQEIDKNNYYADEQMNKIKRFKEDANKEHINTVEFMEAHLQQYLMNEGKKSQKLINGNIGFRNRQPKWSIVDPQLTIEELEKTELHDLIRIKKEPALSEIKKHLSIVNGKVVYKKTGEIIESIKVEEQEPSFNFKLK